MFAVAYKRWWSFSKGSNCKALTKKVLVFWIGGPYRRWSHMENRHNLSNIKIYQRNNLFDPEMFPRPLFYFKGGKKYRAQLLEAWLALTSV